MAAKKSSKAVNKTKYVRGLPATMSAKEIVEKGKADGISLTTNYIYTIRNKAGKAAKTAKSSSPAAAATSTASPTTSAPKTASKVATKTAKKLGRPPGSTNKAATTPSTGSHIGDLYRLIERIVEDKVHTVLTARFGALLQK